MHAMSTTVPDQQPPATRAPRRGGSGMAMFLGLRVVIGVLMAALGAVLITHGGVLVGGLVIALAVVRVVTAVLLWHRRHQHRARIDAWRAQRVGGATVRGSRGFPPVR